MKHNLYRFSAWLICLLMLVVFPFSAFAADGDKTGTLAVSLISNEEYISDVTFNIYRVADENYKPVGEYSAYPVMLKGLSADELGAAAETLAGYTQRDDIPALKTSITNEFGYLRFDDLQKGVYLVVGDIYINGDAVCCPVPFIASLPSFDTDGNAIYDVVASPKFDMWLANQILERNVKKVWSDKGYENVRPAQITVQLLKDGDVADEVSLNASNNWSYSWSDLEPTSVWRVVEKTVPDGYTVAVKNQNRIFTVTNTLTDTSIYDTPETSGNASPTLPQTGQLWWPVPVLLCAGAMILFIGVYISRKNGSSKDA